MQASNFKEFILTVTNAVLPLTIAASILAVIAGVSFALVLRLIFGILFVFLGLGLFLQGTKIGLLPMGEAVGGKIFQHRSFLVIFGLVFVIGFSVTVAEPDLNVLSQQISQVSQGGVSRFWVVVSVSLGVGATMSLGLVSFLLRWSLRWLYLIGYLLTFALFYLAPPEFITLAFDAGGVTTGPVTVPFLLSLGVGIGTVLQSDTPEAGGLGLVGLASIGPIMALLILGIILS